MIIQNAIVCNNCDKFIVSKHRYDFVTCSCGAISVDGGQNYLRRVGSAATQGTYTDMSWELPKELYNACGDAVQEAIDTNCNKYGIANAVMRKLREANRIIADNEPHIWASCEQLSEIMVIEADGTYNRYRKVMD